MSNNFILEVKHFMFEIWDRNIINLLASPLTFTEYLVSLVIISIIKIAIAFLSMYLMASIFYHFQITSLGFSLALFWINLVIFATSFGFLSAVFYPMNILPPPFQKIAYFIPIAHVFEGLRFSLKFNQFDYNSFWLASLLNAVYFALAIGFFTLTLKKVLKSGRLVKLI